MTPHPAPPPHAAYPGLELEQDMGLIRAMDRAHAAGVILLSAVIGAGVAGVLGDGPLGNAGATDGTASAEYERFVRRDSVNDLRLMLSPSVPGEPVAVTLSSPSLAAIEFERVTPEPASVLAGERGQTYIFSTTPGDGRVEVVFRLRPHGSGAARMGIRQDGATGFEIRQFVFP